jgi:hypothetical protein
MTTSTRHRGAFGEADPLWCGRLMGSGSPSLIGGSTAHVRVSPDAVGRYEERVSTGTVDAKSPQSS